MSDETQAKAAGRTAIGVVASNKMQKTATVLLERKVKHPIYGKYVRKSSKVHVHDEDNSCQIGDTVQIAECRPMSRTKSWRLLRVIDSGAAR